ncbi:GHKL domain-containing protein [Clostridium sp.]|uniref:sensor histidine kinase n=1 Tax=Clostridium sp. TaxID=1506 RepID=UPI0026065E13|nr:GHKL domain-containing protein [Clostridium sp.]
MNTFGAAFGAIIILFLSMINLGSLKVTIKEFIGIIFLSQIINILLIILNLSEFIMMIPMVLIPGIFIYKKSKSIAASIAISISSVLIYILSDYIITNIFILLFGIGPEAIRRNNKLYFLIYILEFFAVFCTSKFLGSLINRKTRISNLYINKKFSILAITSLVLTVIIFYTNIMFEHNSSLRIEFIEVNGVLFFFYFILFMVTIYILFKSITKEMNVKNKQIQFESLKEYTSSLEKLYTDMRVFRHDYINILSSLIGYIENKDIDGLEKHFNENIMPLSKGIESNNFKIGILKNVKIPEIKGILSSKLIRAQELGIDTVIEIVEPIEKINMDIIDLSRVIGILLDNAVEAAIECDKPSLKIAIINKENSILIVIINGMKEEVPIYKVYQKGFSTKGENRGLGLYNLKEITNKYANVSLDTLIEDGEFKQILQI